MSRAPDAPAQEPRWHSALICLVVPALLGFSIGGIADFFLQTQTYLTFLRQYEDVIVVTKAFQFADEAFIYVLGYIALFFTGLFLWFIWWVWNEPYEPNENKATRKSLSLLPRFLVIPTILVLGIASGFVANRWFVEREFDGLNLRPHLEEPWQEMAAFYPQMTLTVLLSLSAVWTVWFIARHSWRRLVRC